MAPDLTTEMPTWDGFLVHVLTALAPGDTVVARAETYVVVELDEDYFEQV